MKRCPECYEVYENSDKFCELDGQPLLADPALFVGGPASAEAFAESHTPKIYPNESKRRQEPWLIGAAGVVLGVVICAGIYAAYSAWTDDSASRETGGAPALASQAREPIQPSRPPPPPPRSETTPAPEETATIEPEVTPEPPAAPEEESNSVAARLNQGPVSTGQRKKEGDEGTEVQTIIQMNDGTTVEVDAAWEDGQGVWYRRGGMVAFVDSQRVKAIIGRAAQKPTSGSSQ